MKWNWKSLSKLSSQFGLCKGNNLLNWNWGDPMMIWKGVKLEWKVPVTNDKVTLEWLVPGEELEQVGGPRRCGVADWLQANICQRNPGSPCWLWLQSPIRRVLPSVRRQPQMLCWHCSWLQKIHTEFLSSNFQNSSNYEIHVLKLYKRNIYFYTILMSQDTLTETLASRDPFPVLYCSFFESWKQWGFCEASLDIH